MWRPPAGFDADATAVRWFGMAVLIPRLTREDAEVMVALWDDLHPWLHRRWLGREGTVVLNATRQRPSGSDPIFVERLLGLTTIHLAAESRLLSSVPTRPAELILQRDDLLGGLGGMFDPMMWDAVSVAVDGQELVLLEIGASHPERRMPVLVATGPDRSFVAATPSMFLPRWPSAGRKDDGDPSGDRAPLLPRPPSLDDRMSLPRPIE